MKVVINKCYGGFGVSIEAMKRMVGKCEHVIAHDPVEYFGSKAKAQQAKADGLRDYWYWDSKGRVVTDEHRSQDARNCPVLVSTVEDMKDAASSPLARLRIVNIPDVVTWELDEYDGVESIHEVHQSWG